MHPLLALNGPSVAPHRDDRVLQSFSFVREAVRRDASSEDAWLAVLHLVRPDLMAWLPSVFSSRVDDAADVASDCAFEIWRRRDPRPIQGAHDGGQLRAYYRTMAVRRMLRHLQREERRLGREAALLAAFVVIAVDVAEGRGEDLIDDIRAALSALRARHPRDFEILRRRYFEDQPFLVIARALGLSGSAVRKALGRALGRLRDEYLRAC